MGAVSALALALFALAVVLAVSGATKVPARRQTEDAFEALRIPLVPRALGAAVLPWAEIALAVATMSRMSLKGALRSTSRLRKATSASKATSLRSLSPNAATPTWIG